MNSAGLQLHHSSSILPNDDTLLTSWNLKFHTRLGEERTNLCECGGAVGVFGFPGS